MVILQNTETAYSRLERRVGDSFCFVTILHTRRPPAVDSRHLPRGGDLRWLSSDRCGLAGGVLDQSHCSVRWRAISSIDSRSRSASIAPMHPVPAAVMAWR